MSGDLVIGPFGDLAILRWSDSVQGKETGNWKLENRKSKLGI
jgi:hypothetical protein